MTPDNTDLIAEAKNREQMRDRFVMMGPAYLMRLADRLADALVAINARGQKVLALGGWYRGEGATTLLLCAARRLVERGIRPVLVDADVRRPRLAKRNLRT